jgi:CubicO group peptidase (beta-lactamase class C family)
MFFCMRRCSLLVLFLSTVALVGTLPVGAQPDSINSYVRSEMQYEQIPGLALGLYDHGRVVRQQGFGLSNVELKTTVGSETLFNSGSLAKQFVATAVMMLVEQGKVSLDDSVIHYFPDAPKSWEPVKVKNLLSHTSGLGDYSTTELTAPGAPFDFRTDITEKELLKKLYTLPIAFAPDTDWAYCNTNYVLLGMLIEKVSGEPWGDFLATRIFKPLGMTSARTTDLRAIVPNRASGYVMDDGKLQNEEWTAQTWNSTADGSLYFNVIDLAKWDEALLSAKLLKRSTLVNISLYVQFLCMDRFVS